MLDLISFVGIDEQTNLKSIVDLEESYKEKSISAEYGFLYSESRSKSDDSRYPPLPFILESVLFLHRNSVKTSIHLCGEEVINDYLNGEEYIFELIDNSRVQLNFNIRKHDTDTLIAQVLAASQYKGQKSLILQYNDSKKEFINRIVELYDAIKSKPTIDILYDKSGGYGRPLTAIDPIPGADDFYMGYAGGINPENVLSILRMLENNVNRFKPYYIDMESGIRTNNILDLDKVSSVYSQCVEFIDNYSYF